MAVEQVQKDRNSHKKLVNLRRKFAHFPTKKENVRSREETTTIINILKKATKEPAPGRGEIPHGGDDTVVGGWTFSHFPTRKEDVRSREETTTIINI